MMLCAAPFFAPLLAVADLPGGIGWGLRPLVSPGESFFLATTGAAVSSANAGRAAANTSVEQKAASCPGVAAFGLGLMRAPLAVAKGVALPIAFRLASVTTATAPTQYLPTASVEPTDHTRMLDISGHGWPVLLDQSVLSDR